MRTASCPGCGAPIEFAIGSAVVRVCSHCHSAVARTDRDLQNLGRVADLIETGSALRTGLTGRYQGNGFRITGRVQLRHDTGAVWDEWYAAFDDGRWGWLDEADGNFYVTFETRDADARPSRTLKIGDVVDGMTVFEIGVAEVVSAEGELPWRAGPGTRYTYADLSGPNERFATIEDLDGRVVVFKGRETSLAGLGIAAGDAQPRRARVGSDKLSCTQCGGILNVLAPEKTERIACVHCGALHSLEANGLLAFVRAQKKSREALALRLGSEGTIDGVKYVVAGFMTREASAANERWSWDEYLLFNREQGFRYLTHDEGHWSIEDPVLPGEITDFNRDGIGSEVAWKGTDFRLFERARPRVTYVLGEFPWRVEVGETVEAGDYIAPPHGVSKEILKKRGSTEVNYSVARYLQPGEVARAFGVTLETRPVKPGAMQPNPYPSLVMPWIASLGALLVVAMLVVIFVPRREVFRESFELDRANPKHTTRPFRLEANRQVTIIGFSGVPEGETVDAVGELDPVDGDVAEAFDLWMAYENGRDDEGYWSEDNRRGVAYLSAVPAGEYVLDIQAAMSLPKAGIDIQVHQGVFRWSHLLLAAIALSLFPAAMLGLRYGFEVQRWKDSDYSPYQSDDDDDED